MYGDTTAIRRRAAGLREQADDLRAASVRLAALADAVAWQGLAADAMRRHAHDRAARLRRTAGLHDDAADALDRHAREVERLQDLIAAVEHRVARLLAAAGTLLDRFVPPPSGSMDWLSVELPESFR